MIQENDIAIFSGGSLVKPLSSNLLRLKKLVEDREDCPKDEAVRSEMPSGELVTILVANCSAPVPFDTEGAYVKILHMDSGEIYYAPKESLEPI